MNKNIREQIIDMLSCKQVLKDKKKTYKFQVKKQKQIK